jgi:putative ABC transport system permease protein
MYLLENAFRNVLRNKGRNLLIGAIIFAVIVTTVIALMISATAGGVIDDYKGRFSSEVQITPNMQKVRDEAMASRDANGGRVMMTTPTLNADQYIAFGESEYLADAIYTVQTGLNSDTLTSIAAQSGPGNNLRGMGTGVGTSMPQYYFKMLGGQFSEFEEGMRALAEGEYPDELNECLVSRELAEANGIKTGDTLDFTGELFQRGETDTAAMSVDFTTQEIFYTLTVTGIYDDLTDEYAEGAAESSFANRRNEILTTYETVRQNFIPDYNGMKITATYYLYEPAMLDAFAAEVRAKGLPDTFDVTTDTATYEKIVGPVEGLKSISVTFMIVVLIFGAVIIALLASIAIRERKYEIGVLRAMGMKKKKVAFGLWSEMLIVTCTCLVLGLGVGVLAAQPVTDALLAGQIEAAEAAASDSTGMMGLMGGMMLQGTNQAAAGAVPLSELNVSLDVNTVLMIVGIALLLATLAALISILRITKYEPIKILMERN